MWLSQACDYKSCDAKQARSHLDKGRQSETSAPRSEGPRQAQRKAGWDHSILAIELQHLASVDLDFDVSVTGFEVGEIDLILQEAAAQEDEKDEGPIEIRSGPAVTKPGDIWLLETIV